MTLGRPGALLLAATLSALNAHGQARTLTMDELEMERLLEQASEMFERRDIPIEEISADFEYRCLRSIGDTPFCECLVRRRPYPLRFEQYIGITSRTRAELDYDTLGESSKAIVDRVFRLRDECVAG